LVDVPLIGLRAIARICFVAFAGVGSALGKTC